MRVDGAGFRVWGLQERVKGVGLRGQGAICRVSEFGCRGVGFEIRIQGLGCRVHRVGDSAVRVYDSDGNELKYGSDSHEITTQTFFYQFHNLIVW